MSNEALSGSFRITENIIKQLMFSKVYTEFPRVWVWVRVGYPQLTIYPRQPKNSGVQLTICRFETIHTHF